MSLQDDEELFDTPSRILTLTRNEALYLDDSLTMMLETNQGDIFSTMRPLIATAQLPAPVDLIEKIANAVLYTLDIENRGQEAEILVNDGDLYCLRELAQSYIRIGDEPVGFSLKRKVCDLLYGDLLKKESSDRIAFKLLTEVDITPNPNKVPKDKPLE